jgi:hypothetical protein
MEMHRCLPVLQEQNMGAGKTADELEKDRPLVIGARVWLAVSRDTNYGSDTANATAH